MDTNFPRNFADAIDLCRILGVKYIWIDSLCIIQSDANDFSKEAPRMHQVYGSSYLNIAATSARNSTEGLHRKRRINLLSPSIVPCHWQGRHRYLKVIREDFWSGELLAEPLYKRAWVAQERMLAPRTLNFGSKQLFWQCLTVAACETMPNGIPALIHSAGQEELQWRRLIQQSRENKLRDLLSSEQDTSSTARGELSNNDQIELQEVWRDAVKNYTSCNITNTGDKLPAIAGLAQVMFDCCQEEYIAGLWGTGDDLVAQLGWRVKDCKNVEGRPARRQRKHEYRAPTWAWPSVVDGIVEIPRRVKLGADTTLSLKVSEKHLEYARKESHGWEFMELNGGWLDVTGLLWNVPFYDAKDPETPHWCWELNGVTDQERPWVFMFLDEPYSPDAGQKDDACTVNAQKIPNANGVNATATNFDILPLFFEKEDLESGQFYSGRALVVREVTDPTIYKHKPKTGAKVEMFTRIGLVEFRRVHESLWDQFIAQKYGGEDVNGRESDSDGRIRMFLL